MAASTPVLPASLPAIHHAVRNGSAPSPQAEDALEVLRGVVQAYRIARNLAVDAEAEQAAHVVRHILDRLARLRGAYGEWRLFDAPAYFDLTPEQAQLLLEMGERVTVVHALFHVDLLLPSVQELLHFWVQMGATPNVRGAITTEEHERFAQQTRPELERRWARAVAVVSACRRLLTGDATWLAANAAEEERWRWRDAGGKSVDLLGNVPITQIPSLALTIDFPLPTWKQPGRMRRLRRNRARQARRKR